MKGVAIVQEKGGVGKTTLCHLLALGAAWNKVPAYLMHTDNRPPIQVTGRPYGYHDARNPSALVTLIDSIVEEEGLCIIDGGGNRPDFDQWIASCVNLVIVPVTPDIEAVNIALAHRERLVCYGASNVQFLLNTVSNHQRERARDNREYFRHIPDELILGRLGKVAAVKRLREDDKSNFVTPPTPVNNLARKLFRLTNKELQI